MATPHTDSTPAITLGRRHWLAIGAILVAALIACAPILIKGAVDGHSIEYNLVWLKHFAAQLGAGDWYPRWLMGMNRGAGSPVFFYYAPLPYYITSIGVGLLPHMSLNVQLAAGEWLLIALSGVAFFLYARRHAGITAAALAATLYMLLPYHFEVDLWLRQDMGELTIYIFMPLVLMFTERIFEEDAVHNAIVGLAISYAALMFSHLPSALLYSVCLGAFVLVLYGRQFSWRRLRHFAAAIALGVALAAVYWVPALFTQQFISSDKLWTPYFDFHRWLYPAAAEAANPFTRRLIAVIDITSIIFLASWLTTFFGSGRKMHARLQGPLVLMAAAWFLISPASLWLWEHAPALWKVQFPWRVVIVMDLATAMVVMHALHTWPQRTQGRNAALMACVAGLMVYCVASADVQKYLGPVDNAREVTENFYAVRDGLDAPEYTTPWTQLSARDIAARPVAPGLVEYNRKNGAVHIAKWSPEGIALNVRLAQPTMLEIRQFYFPNWKVFVQGLRTSLTPQPATHTGLLRVRVPAGNYRLTFAMAPLIQERIGEAITVVALMLMAAIAVIGRRSARLCAAR